MSKKKGGKKRSNASPNKPAAAAEPAESERPGDQAEPAEPEPSATARDEEEVASESPPAPADAEPKPAPAAWGNPFARIERAWTWFEVRLLIVVVLSLLFAMVAWVALGGMSQPVESQSKAGLAFRAFIGALGLGLTSSFLAKRLSLGKLATGFVGAGSIVLGFLMAPSWRSTGVEYFGQLQNWLQEGSSLTMFGGLRGVSTRLTILLAFLGGSLAAASGKHINIDVALRFVNPKLKLPVFVLQSIATVAFCAVAAWGFFEYIAITNFNAPVDATPSAKISHVNKLVSQDLFLWRKQVGFDLSATPHVLGGGKWDDPGRFTGRQWNQYLETSGYTDVFTKEEVAALKSGESSLDSPRIALAVGPDGQPRNQLVRTMNLTFSVGFLIMGFRFLLRLLLVLSRHESLEEGEGTSGTEDDSAKGAA
jgi:TRAP-type C4-dicarboxylate transport system permease small subunit